MSEESVPCIIQAPVPLQVGNETSEQGLPGVSVIDVTFPASKTVNVQEISFKNYYTAFLTIKVQQRAPKAPRAKTGAWRTCVRNLCLMPNPHLEEGSEDYVSVCRQQFEKDLEHTQIHANHTNATLMLCDTNNVVSIRLILRQPSPVWLTFTLEELQINPPGRQSPQKGFSWWMSHLPSKEKLQKLQKGLPDPERVSSEVQQMWALTEVMRSGQSAVSVGRFDVDGCYDINLLSYT